MAQDLDAFRGGRRDGGLDALWQASGSVVDHARRVRCESDECQVARGFLVGSLIAAVASALAMIFLGERD